MDLRQFTYKALNEADTFKITEKLLSGRDIVKGYTVDSFTSKDLDDGFNIFEKNGNYLLQVSIADVAEAVTFDSELYSIALDRLETRYLKDSNLPMLPKSLSEDKMSLMPGGLRPSITFDIEINPDTEIIDFAIRETAFHSLAKLSYEKFDVIRKNADNSEESVSFNKMSELASKLLEKRRQKGALAIYDIKKGIYTNEEGMIMALEDHNRFMSHLVVQEFMILTNKTLAWFFAKNDLLLLNRNHTARQSAPNRNEILDQINTVIVNPEHLESLRARGSLWFNRATYSPIVKGHFGLNEAVYCHATSPIRRIADLINHLLIKSYLHKTPPPYTLNQLISLSDKINNEIAEIKDKKAEMFKEKAIITGENKLTTISEQYLTELPVSEFTAILYSAVKSNIMNDKLKSAIKSRFESNNIDMKIIYTILFKSEKDSPEWSEMKVMCINYIKDNKGFALSLLNIFVQKAIIDKYDTDLLESEEGYKAKITAFQNGKEITTQFYTVSPRKKDAISMSAYNIIRLLLDMPVENPIQNSMEEVIKIDSNITNNEGEELYANPTQILNEKENSNTNPNQTLYDEVNLSTSPSQTLPTGEDFKKESDLTVSTGNDQNKNNVVELNMKSDIQQKDDVNHVGILMEMCQKNKGWKVSDFDFKLSGLSHLPTITCTVILTTPEITIEGSVISSNKKTAKQEAAKKILDKLNTSGIIKPSEKTLEINIDADNLVGSLQEICAKSKLPNPEYFFRNIGTVYNPLFECELKIYANKKPYFFKKIAENKKSAKQNCAEECLKIIHEIVKT